MPIYDWRCPACQHVTEVIRPMSDYLNPPEECDSCGQYYYKPNCLIISRPEKVKGFILLGESGWHCKEYTRYRSIK